MLDETCATDINTNFAVVAPTTVNNRAVDFYAAIGQAHQGGSASPYPIYLCEGTFPLNETVVLFADVRIYGRGVDVSIITQSDTTQMGGMFTLNDNHLLEFHNVTLYNGRARITDAGAVLGGAVRVHSGTLRVHDSKFQGNEAAFLGGAIAGGVNIELVRSHFLGNLADDSGGVLYVANATAECARFDTNIAVLYRGGALAIDGGGVINGSSFSGNQAGQEANDIFNYNWGDPINAQGNWWATPPQTPDIISGGVDASAALGSDPTADYVTGDYYNPALGECQMHTPEPLPPPPTPTPTPTPDTCEVIATNAAAKLRIQPALDDQNWLFEVPATYVYYNDNTVVNGAALPARDWLWPDEDRPDSLTLTAIYVIARGRHRLGRS